MINYIRKNKDYKLDISLDNDYFTEDTTIQKYLNKFLSADLRSFSSLEKNTRMIMKFKSKAPIYIDKNTLLMCIISYRVESSLYINYFAIYNYKIKGEYLLI